jgi:ABC-2 type transport system permease protein
MSAIAIQTQTHPRRHSFRMLVASELRLARRYPVQAIVAIGIPLLLLLIFGSIPTLNRPDKALGGISFFNLYVPTLIMFVLLVVGVATLPQQLSTYRQQGVLRRMSTTPVPPSWLLAAQVVVSLLAAVVGITILLGLGAGAFNLSLPDSLSGCLVSLAALILTAAAMIGLGLCIGAVAGTPRMAQALTFVAFYPLAFFSGLYVPLSELHSNLIHQIAKVLPTGAGASALAAAFEGRSVSAESLLVLAGWALATSVLATRLFRWE